MTDRELLTQITRILIRDKDWNADTLNDIANALECNDYLAPGPDGCVTLGAQFAQVTLPPQE